MIARRLVDTAEIPGGGTLRLMARGTEFSIMLGANELMNSRLSGSEESLATLAIAKIPATIAKPTLLIGGLGMGFTLRAALADLAAATIVVAELVPAVVDWARGAMAEVFGNCLKDSRVNVLISDVAILIGSAQAAYDAILLDVDNGPDGITIAANDGLYSIAGLAATRAALRPGGVLAIWSSAPDARFTCRLKSVGFAVEECVVRARGTRRGARHVIWLAIKPDA